MKKFYLNHNFENPLKVEISPNLAETLDESLDNMTISLGISESKKPYAPTINVVGVYEEDEEQNRTLINEFIISSDNVELATQNPLRYKHTLSLIQKSQFLTKHFSRNSVFSLSLEQANGKKYLIGGNWYYDNWNFKLEDYTSDNKITIDLSKNNIVNMRFKPNFKAFYSFGYPSQGVTDIQLYAQERILENWSEIFDNSSVEPSYPKIKFEIGNEQREFELENLVNDEKIELPDDIKTWIRSFSQGNLVISVDSGLGFDSQTNPGWDISSLLNLDCPIYGKLTIDIDINLVDMSVYNVINTLLKQYEKETALYNESNDSSIRPLFKMPDDSNTKRSELKELLLTTQAPNFIFTQSSMFDALSEIFRLFDATFRIDEDGYLEIEYFNDRKAEDKIVLSDSMKAGRTSSLGEERFANRLVTFFQNTQVNDRFPNSDNEKASAGVRSKTFGVPEMSDFVFEVPNKINYITKASIRVRFKYTSVLFHTELEGYEGGDYTTNIAFYDEQGHLLPFVEELIDITNNVVESQIWTSLPSTGSSNPFDYQLCKENTISYQRGTKYLEIANYYKIVDELRLRNTQKLTLLNIIEPAIKEYFGINDFTDWNYEIDTDVSDWRKVRLAVEYNALIDGKLVNESIDNKYDGEILTNQNNGSIDIFKLGLNMVGLSLKLGQPTLTMTQKFTNWNNRIKKGQWFVEDGEVWVANTCSYVLITNDMVQATIEFVKNFNSLASRIELNREKRLTNISNELTVKCEETYGEFIYYVDSMDNIPECGEQIAFDNDVLSYILPLVFGYEYENPYYDEWKPKVEYAAITALDSNNNVIELENGNTVDRIAIPLVIYGSGNSVCFEMSFDSPISAGNQLLDNYEHRIGVAGEWIPVTGWFSRAVLYSREDGTAEKFTIEFIDIDEDISQLFPMMKKQITSGSDYTESNLMPLNYDTLGVLENFAYYKKPNEIFALNYQLHFLPLKGVRAKDCFIGNEFIKHNPFSEGLNVKRLKFVYTLSTQSNFEYSILDTKGQADNTADFEVSGVYDDRSLFSTRITIVPNIPFLAAPFIKTWAIVDENNNIYFASNNGLRSNPALRKAYADITFITRHHRLI